MATTDRVTTTAGDLVRQFSHYSDVALHRPVVVTKNGRPRNVLISVEEYELTESFDGKGIDVSGDDWTWHVEDELSYLAIDDEPESESEFPAAIERNMTAPVIAALQEIDQATLIVLADLLAASGDPLSLAFATFLRA